MISLRDTVWTKYINLFAKNHHEAIRATHFQLHIAILEVLRSHLKSQSDFRYLQTFAAHFDRFVMPNEFGLGVLAIYEPRQIDGWLWSARCAINVNFVADLVLCTTTADFWIRIGQNWKKKKRKEKKRQKQKTSLSETKILLLFWQSRSLARFKCPITLDDWLGAHNRRKLQLHLLVYLLYSVALLRTGIGNEKKMKISFDIAALSARRLAHCDLISNIFRPNSLSHAASHPQLLVCSNKVNFLLFIFKRFMSSHSTLDNRLLITELSCVCTELPLSGLDSTLFIPRLSDSIPFLENVVVFLMWFTLYSRSSCGIKSTNCSKIECDERERGRTSQSHTVESYT